MLTTTHWWITDMRYRVTFKPQNCADPQLETREFIARELDDDFFCGKWAGFTWNNYLIAIAETADITRLLLTHSERIAKVVDMEQQKVVFNSSKSK
jgi:hypothetical protein